MADTPTTKPPINTDEWADYMIATLTTGGTVQDDDLAALVGVQTQQVRKVIIALAHSFNGDGAGGGVTQAYVDVQDRAVTAALTVLINAVESDYVEADMETLAAAKAYTDAHSDTGGVEQSYVDERDISVLDAAKSYTDTGVQNVLSAANAYTDQHSGSGGVTQAYVDQGDAGAVSTAANDATGKANDSLNTAKAYTDSSVTDLASGVGTMMDGKISAQYTDTTQPAIASGDTATLTAAKAYTDSKGTGGVAQSYVDNADTNTLNAAKNDASTKATNAQTAATTAAATDATTKANNAQSAAITAAATDATTKANNAQSASEPKFTDTGWVAVVPISGYANGSTIKYRKIRNRVSLQGIITTDAGGALAATTGVFTLPAGVRPIQQKRYAIPGNSNSMISVNMNANGTFDIGAPPTSTTNTAFIDAVDFYVD